MTFLFPSLLAIGLPLVGLPLVIHLIQLRRQQHVSWAAMDFLLVSQRRNRKWILLRQFLLLLARTTVIAAVVLMLAGPVLRSAWGRLLGKGATHHVILLDDSFSMADQWDDTTALEEAQRVVQVVLDQATQQAGRQKLTLLRFSEAADLTPGAQADQFAHDLDRQHLETVAERLRHLSVSETDRGPLEALRAALGLPTAAADETRIAYLVSDYRDWQWQPETEVVQALGQLARQVAQLHLIQCVDRTRPNLAITRLAPESGLRAAGVETWMELEITNFGEQPATAVVVDLLQDGQRLPAVAWDEIPAGQSVTRRFRTIFPTAGGHQLQARLASDALATDNVRYFACHVPAKFPVLLIDGSREGDDGYYLRTALDPGGLSQPGWSPQIERPQFLRQHEKLKAYSSTALEGASGQQGRQRQTPVGRAVRRFAAIFLLDVARLDPPEVAVLENYVRAGGGVGIFLGPQVERDFYNQQLYREGAGLLPVPLDVPTELVRDGSSSTPDLSVSEHPLFRVFRGQRNSFLAVIGVNFYYGIAPEWRLPATGTTRVLARLRNGAPYVLEKKLGAGRVVLHLAKLSPRPTALGPWSNWSLNPAFPVYANELVGHLSATQRQFALHEVGAELRLELEAADYSPEIRLLPPTASAVQVQTIKAEAGRYRVGVGPVLHSGVWQFELQPNEGEVERRLRAVNVSAVEGDLRRVDREQLAERLEGIDYQYALAWQMQANTSALAGFQLQDTLLYLLVLLLLIEPWLAYQAGCYPSPAKSAVL